MPKLKKSVKLKAGIKLKTKAKAKTKKKYPRGYTRVAKKKSTTS